MLCPDDKASNLLVQIAKNEEWGFYEYRRHFKDKLIGRYSISRNLSFDVGTKFNANVR